MSLPQTLEHIHILPTSDPRIPTEFRDMRRGAGGLVDQRKRIVVFDIGHRRRLWDVVSAVPARRYLAAFAG